MWLEADRREWAKTAIGLNVVAAASIARGAAGGDTEIPTVEVDGARGGVIPGNEGMRD